MPQSSLESFHHSLAHLLAAAVLRLWPDAKPAIGPVIENGFYYDFEFTKPISEENLPLIEKTMRDILKTWDKFEKIEETKDSAQSRYLENEFKNEIIQELAAKGEQITSYKSGNFIDLCRGGHVESANDINPDAFKLTHLAGAYWRGDEKNKMLTRIYGVTFATKEGLENYLHQQEEAKKRDHRKLGKELDLFTFSDLVGPGLPLWTPKGTVLRNLLDDFVWQLRKQHGYEQVDIPHLAKKELYQTSGHWEKFYEELFRITTREGHEFALKPMNCPHHTQIYARRQFSYRQLPQRYATTTKVYRDEQTGELTGLSRVRAITQDDAHVFCRYAQIKNEILKIWDIINEFYAAIDFTLSIHLSLSDPAHPEKYLGSKELWRSCEQQMKEILSEKHIEASEAIGEAAFYGPKIDFLAKDSLQRQWQLATIQLDLNMPERFDLVCINEKGERERIAMIHAAIMGAIERYVAILIEHFAGAFPLWLAPVQFALLPVGEKQRDYSKKVFIKFQEHGLRAELYDSNKTLTKRIRDAEQQKIPYILVMGEREMSTNTTAVRKRGAGDLGQKTVDTFVREIQEEIRTKTSAF